MDARDDFRKRRLSRAVLTSNGVDLSRAKGKVDVFKNEVATQNNVETLDSDQRICGSSGQWKIFL